MKRRKMRKISISHILVLGLLLSGCSNTETSTDASTNSSTDSSTNITSINDKNGVTDQEISEAINVDGLTELTVNSHNVNSISSSEYGSQYTIQDTVNVTYTANDITGILHQTVSKDYEFYYNNETNKWEMLSNAATSCEVDSSVLAGSSWKCENLDTETQKQLFGSDIPSDEDGTVYLRFLKTIGPFAFNMNNENNTESERYFTSVGTNGKMTWVGSNDCIEKSFSIQNGSVTDSGDITMEITSGSNKLSLSFGKDVIAITEQEYDTALGLEVDENKVYIETLTKFDVTTTSIENGEWKTEMGYKEGNKSPELTWSTVDGATKYAILMIDDTTASNVFHWFDIVETTHIDEGMFTDSTKDYFGPYPPETHEYDVYVVALADEPQEKTFKLDTSGGDINARLTDLNTKKDGSVGNVIAYGHIEANYTPVDDYYGYR